MTFIVSWKRNGIAYLCADSALTTSEQEPSKLPDTSSFGEQTINVQGHQVAERSTKIYNLRRAAIAISGDYSLAKRVVMALRDELVHVDDIRTAFTRAIDETLTDVESRKMIRLILAAPCADDATVLFYNSDGDLTVRELENDHIVRFGSLDSDRRLLAAEIIVQAGKSSDVPTRQLAIVLGLLQSLGINTNLLDQSVGGAFYGAYIDSNGITWQGDALYIVRQPGEFWTLPVSTSIRDDAVIIKSGITTSATILANTLNVGFDHEQWMTKWSPYVLQGFELTSHDFVTFLTAGVPNCTIVEMLGHATSFHLHMPISVSHTASDQPYGEMSLSPDLKNAVDEPEVDPNTGQTRMRVTFYPYQSAKSD